MPRAQNVQSFLFTWGGHLCVRNSTVSPNLLSGGAKSIRLIQLDSISLTLQT
ncbi:hypothetical protein RISK_005046 [Rhodopirellula islandica]|uniref:Uncharacterized protein n=1 Tax=Rhodopirellula islandica TaxID=595434 RepID=A0A0J1B7E4_RHOIS|nr:hypothetical protein RISK_005046 [Rhodopirellula islandica]